MLGWMNVMQPTKENMTKTNKPAAGFLGMAPGNRTGPLSSGRSPYAVFVLCALLFLSVGQAQNADVAPPVTSVYEDLYDQLSGDLASFDSAINWNGAKYPVLYAGELSDANSNTGPKMLTAMLYIQQQLLVLKALGFKAVAIEAGFPAMYEPFYAATSPEKDGSCPGDSGVAASVQQQRWASFYSDLAAAARALGFKVIVSAEVMDNGGQISGTGSWASCLTTWYPTLGWTQFQAARAQAAVAVARALTPDYFVLSEEPDTEANTTGYSEIETPAGAVTMLDRILASVTPLKAQIPNMQIGAGFGNWTWNYQEMAQAYTDTACSSQPCVTPKLDFLDMHFFLVNTSAPSVSSNPNFQQDTLAIVDIANAAGVPVTISQGWLQKVRDGEWRNASAPGSSIEVQEARETYSFWTPLDSRWLTTFEGLANYGKMAFATPFDTSELSAYQTWSNSTSIQQDGGTLPAVQVFHNEGPVAKAAAQNCVYSATGMALYRSIVPEDTVPPSAPGDLTFEIASKSSVLLSWSPSSDNVGVAGYRIWRGGVQLPETFSTTILDSGILQNESYLYQVKAFDLAGNVSEPASVTVFLQ